MSSIRDTRLGLTAAIALVALFGLAGRMDYIEARQAECASYVKPHEYNEAFDACVPINPDQTSNNQEHYHAAPQASRPQHH